MRGILLMVLILLVCGGWTQTGNRLTRSAYFEKYKDIAIHEMKRSGVPASITLAQGALESGDGNSTLARQGNNHFGIKCHQDWNGRKIFQDDDEKNECFRKYNSVEDSYRDHSDYLKSKTRYAFLFELDRTDYKGWARGLKKAGYATSPSYAESLIRIIEEFDLHQYDLTEAVDRPAAKARKLSKSNTMARETGIINHVRYIRAAPGDTYESITEALGKIDWEIPQFNDAGPLDTLKQGQVVFIQPKKNRAQTGQHVHVLKPGETLRMVSQTYAIKLDRLYALNHLEPGARPAAGTTLQLRKALAKPATAPVIREPAPDQEDDGIRVEFNLE